jgi:hypothetical protein
VKSAADQEIHQGIIVSKVYAGLGRKLEWVIVFNLPAVYRVQEILHAPTISDEVVIDDKEIAFEAEIVRRLQLTDEILGRLGPATVTEKVDDIAELTVEGAPAGKLDGKGVVRVQITEVKSRDRCCRHVRPGFAGVQWLGPPLPKVFEKGKERYFSLTQHKIVDTGNLFVTRRRVGTPGGNGDTLVVTPGDNIRKGVGLYDHSRDHDEIRPLEIAIGQFLDIHIHKAALELISGDCGDGEESQRRHRSAFSNKGE